MRQVEDVEMVGTLAARGLNTSEIARQTGIPRSTVRDWLSGGARCNRRTAVAPFDPARLPASYPYLLGMYLGDGCLSFHPRDVWRLRICLDLRYPGIVAECRQAIADAVPGNRVGELKRRGGYRPRPEPTLVELSAYSKRWPEFFPQHGPGRKHTREIALAPWQWSVVEAAPHGLLRGLIHSDGCRFVNTGTNWRHPRYSFHNLSEGLLRIFERTCDLVGVHHTRAPHTVYVSRKADVARLDTFIGPKR